MSSNIRSSAGTVPAYRADNHEYCSPECAGAEREVALLEPRDIGQQPDIFDIEELREAVPGVGREEGHTGVEQTLGPDPAAENTVAADAGVGVGSGGGGAKKKGQAKKTATLCAGSSFTAASVRQTLDDVLRLASVKEKLWARVRQEIQKFRGEPGASDTVSQRASHLLSSLDAEVGAAARTATLCVQAADRWRGKLEQACAGAYEVSFGCWCVNKERFCCGATCVDAGRVKTGWNF